VKTLAEFEKKDQALAIRPTVFTVMKEQKSQKTHAYEPLTVILL
jgi:hypothetical protein